MFDHIHIFHNTEALEEYFVEQFFEIANAYLQTAHCLWIAIPGGNTPINSLKKISLQHNQMHDWNKVHILMTDEHILTDANYNMITSNLKWNNDVDIPCSLIYHFDINTTISHKLHLLWLGMGIDGHIASIFPPINERLLLDMDSSSDHSMHNITVKTTSPQGDPRISLSLAYMQQSEKIFIMISGKQKSKIVATMLNEPLDKNRSHSMFPVSVLKTKQNNITLLLDAQAASLTDINTLHGKYNVDIRN